MLGHVDRTGGNNTSWNAAHMSQGCSKQALINRAVQAGYTLRH